MGVQEVMHEAQVERRTHRLNLNLRGGTMGPEEADTRTKKGGNDCILH